MIIKSFLGGPIKTLAYFIIDEKSKKAAIIDPVKDSFYNFSDYLKDFELVYIINTHGHFDHIVDNYLFREKTKAKLVIHRKDEFMIKDPMVLFDLKIRPTKADDYVKEGDILVVGALKFNIIETQGHTEGSICLYEEKQKIIFTGDTLFKGAYGRTDLPGGNEEKMKESLRGFTKLSKGIKVYPGHGESTIIGKELIWLVNI